MTKMTMNEITLNPKSAAVKRFINRAVEIHLSDSPVRHAFNHDWPVNLSELEAQEVLQAVRDCQPHFYNPHGGKHKELTIKELMTALKKQEQQSQHHHNNNHNNK
jgi:hypothetical protein